VIVGGNDRPLDPSENAEGRPVVDDTSGAGRDRARDARRDDASSRPMIPNADPTSFAPQQRRRIRRCFLAAPLSHRASRGRPLGRDALCRHCASLAGDSRGPACAPCRCWSSAAFVGARSPVVATAGRSGGVCDRLRCRLRPQADPDRIAPLLLAAGIGTAKCCQTIPVSVSVSSLARV
jgi:hypothetical protein